MRGKSTSHAFVLQDDYGECDFFVPAVSLLPLFLCRLLPSIRAGVTQRIPEQGSQRSRTGRQKAMMVRQMIKFLLTYQVSSHWKIFRGEKESTGVVSIGSFGSRRPYQRLTNESETRRQFSALQHL